MAVFTPRARPLAFTGKRSRRRLLGGLVASPALLARSPPGAAATDYASAREVLETIDRLEAEVEARLRAIASGLPSARAFEASVLRDRARQQAVRRDLRRRLGLPDPSPSAPVGGAGDSLSGLREAQQRLVHAHAEGLAALGSPFAVARLVEALVDLSRQLTVIDLWLEAEESRG